MNIVLAAVFMICSMVASADASLFGSMPSASVEVGNALLAASADAKDDAD